MSLNDNIKSDFLRISTNSNDFGVEIFIQAPTNEELLTRGFHTKHFTGYDMDGVRVSSKIASVAIAEQNFIDSGFPYRDQQDRVSLLNCRVRVDDSAGILNEYIVKQVFPDEKIGVMVLILGDYE